MSGDNGWSTYAVNLIHAAIENGDEVHVLVENEITSNRENIKTYILPYKGKDLMWNPFFIYKTHVYIRKLIAKIKPDVVHVTCEPHIMSFIFKTSVPVVLTIHGTYAQLPETIYNSIKKSISKIFFLGAIRKTSAIIAVSEKTKKTFLEYVDTNIPLLDVIHNSVRITAPILNYIKEKIPFYIITVGEVKYRKGIHNSILFFSRWAEDRKKLLVYDVVGLCGESQYVREVKNLAERMSSEYFQVIFHGHVTYTQKEQLLIRSHIYSHLESVEKNKNDVEGFGMGIIEAAGYGVPALVIDGSATSEAVLDTQTGYIIKKDDTENEINIKIDALLSADKKFAKESYAWANAHNVNDIYIQVMAIYNKVCV